MVLRSASSQCGVGRGCQQRIEVERARQVVEGQVEAGAGREQVLYLGIGLGAAQHGIELNEDEFRHRQAQRSLQLAGHQLSDQRAVALTRPAEFDHVQAIVVCLHDRRQRAARP